MYVDKHELTGRDGGPLEIKNYNQMTDEELIKEAEKYGIDLSSEG